jgi:hypothetical protein
MGGGGEGGPHVSDVVGLPEHLRQEQLVEHRVQPRPELAALLDHHGLRPRCVHSTQTLTSASRVMGSF